MKHSELGRDKNIIGLTERQMVFFSAKQLKTEVPVFINLQECIGVVIFMKDGSLLCYHKFGLDGMKSFRLALEKLKIKGEDVDKIELFGGALNDVVFPRVGDVIFAQEVEHDVGEDGEIHVLHRHSRLHIFEKKDIITDIDNFFFSLNKDFAPQLLPVSAKENRIASVEESGQHDLAVQNFLNSRTRGGDVYGVLNKGHAIFSFYIKSIENFVGYRNRHEVVDVLKRVFKDVDIEGKIYHHYARSGAHVGILNGYPVPLENFKCRLYKDKRDFQDPFDSDNEDDIYNRALQNSRFAVNGPIVHVARNVSSVNTYGFSTLNKVASPKEAPFASGREASNVASGYTNQEGDKRTWKAKMRPRVARTSNPRGALAKKNNTSSAFRVL